MKRKKTTFLTLILIMFISITTNGWTNFSQAEKTNNEGVKKSEKRNYNEALNDFQEAINIYEKGGAKVLHNKAWAYELNKEYSKAIKFYEKALQRNPKQIASKIKLAHLYYLTEEYLHAMQLGEEVLKQDPKNEEVLKWLPNAYKLSLLTQQKKDKNDDLSQIAQQPTTLAKDSYFNIYLDTTIRTGYYYAEQKIKYINTKGLLLPLAYNFSVSYNIKDMLAFRFKIGNPCYGAADNDLNSLKESFEAIYKFHPFYVGLGITGTHYKNDVNFGQLLELNDLKVGVLFGAERPNQEFYLSYYPRLLPFDTSKSKGKTMDNSELNLNYNFKLNHNFKLKLGFRMLDFYFFDHDQPYCNWYGIYDTSIGLQIGNLESVKKLPFMLELKYTQRIYFQHLNNTNPYSIMSGQGWFGIDRTATPKTKIFTQHFRSTSSVLQFIFTEKIAHNFYLYEHLEIEIVGAIEEHSEMNIKLGTAVTF